MVFGLPKFTTIKTSVTKMVSKTQKALSIKGEHNKEHFEFGLNNPAFALRMPPRRK